MNYLLQFMFRKPFLPCVGAWLEITKTTNPEISNRKEKLYFRNLKMVRLGNDISFNFEIHLSFFASGCYIKVFKKLLIDLKSLLFNVFNIVKNSLYL